jgi:cysteinyl-tRNA synthetase
MSKSLGNFVTIREFLKEHSPAELRMFVFSSLYRSPVDVSDASIDEAKGKIDRLEEFVSRLSEVTTQGVSPFPLEDFIEAFWQALKNDFNTPKAFAELFQLITETNKLIDAHTLSANDAQKLLAFMQEVNAIFNILPISTTAVPEHISSLIAKREEARAEGRFADADVLRKEIEEEGFNLKDTPQGPKIKKLK